MSVFVRFSLFMGTFLASPANCFKAQTRRLQSSTLVQDSFFVAKRNKLVSGVLGSSGRRAIKRASRIDLVLSWPSRYVRAQSSRFEAVSIALIASFSLRPSASSSEFILKRLTEAQTDHANSTMVSSCMGMFASFTTGQ